MKVWFCSLVFFWIFQKWFPDFWNGKICEKALCQNSILPSFWKFILFGISENAFQIFQKGNLCPERQICGCAYK
jgi:hypothetical protein